jgi:ATP-binding cassette subfamily C protein
MLHDLMAALRLTPSHRRWQWALLVPLAVLAAAFESLGAGIVLALGQVVADPAGIAHLSAFAWARGWARTQDTQRIITAVTAGVVVFYLVRGCLLTTVAWMQQTVVHRTTGDVAARLFDAYLRAPYVFHLRRNSATLIQTVSQSAEAVFAFGLNSAVNIGTEALTLLALVAVLAVAAPLAMLVSIAAVGVMLVGPLLVTRVVAPRWGAGIKRAYEALLKDLQQGLAAFKEVRIAGVEDHFLSGYRVHRGELASLSARQGTLTTAVRVFVETVFIGAVLLAIIVMTAGAAEGSRLVGLMALYAYVGFRVVPAANRLAMNVAVLQGARPHIHAVSADLALLGDSSASKPAADPTDRRPFNDRIQLTSVTYTYDGGRAPALQDVTLTIRRAESVGIVGPTGAGKSTLLDVLLGFLAPQAGCVLVDGRNIHDDIRAWRDHVGYVSQTFVLLDDSLRRNVAFGQPDAAIDDARVMAALQLAHLNDTADGLRLGLDAPLGERGVSLSGGQRQRVAIARALYHDPDVLVFDEATAALDSQTEREIIRAIDELRGARTVIIVAHRLSTVRGCDRLIILEDGRVTGDGSYDTLLARHAAFRGMALAAQ